MSARPFRAAGFAIGAIVALALGALAGCAPRADYAPGGKDVARFTVTPRPWRAETGPSGKATAVVEDGATVVVFGEAGVALYAEGPTPVGEAHDAPFRAAGTLAGADGSGAWPVGVDARGRFFRARAKGRLEPIGDRYAVGRDRVIAVAAIDDGRVALGLAPLDADAKGPIADGTPIGLVAIADGARVRFFDYGALDAIAGGGGKLAVLPRKGGSDDAPPIRVIDLAHEASGPDATYAVPGARAIAVDARGRLAVATADAVLSDDGLGRLRLRFVARDHAVSALVASGETIWFRDGRQLGRVIWTDETARVELTDDAPVSDDARLFSSASGDVWTVEASGVRRFGTAAGAVTATSEPVDPDARWARTIAPIYAERCAKCHARGGSAGIDLSTADAWSARAGAIRTRVLERGDMPPNGALSTVERAAIDGWTKPR